LGAEVDDHDRVRGRGGVQVPDGTDPRWDGEGSGWNDAGVRRLLLLAVTLLVALGVGAASAEASSSPSPSTVSPDETLERPLEQCISALPPPGCGHKPEQPGDRGGWMQWTLFGLMILGLTFIGWRVVRGARRSSVDARRVP